MGNSHIIFGQYGEEIAAKYLKGKKYKILHTNYRCKLGELDIVAKIKDDIVICEVKTRNDLEHGLPSQAVNYYKQKKISKVALMYLQKHNLFDYNVRFDVIEIWKIHNELTLNHIENAFEFIE